MLENGWFWFMSLSRIVCARDKNRIGMGRAAEVALFVTLWQGPRGRRGERLPQAFETVAPSAP
jgi:hypothetical protein